MSVASDEMLKTMRRLRSVREYTSEPVSDEDIQAILDVARWTATGGNRQPYELVVVRDAAVRQKFGEWGAKPAAAAPLVFLITGPNPGSFDEGRMAERICLAAAARGLGSCVATLKESGPDQAKALLGVPADRRATVVVAVGHTDTEARKALPKNPTGGRKPLNEFAHFDRMAAAG